MSNKISIPINLTSVIVKADGAVRVVAGVPGPRGFKGDPGDLSTAIFPGRGTYGPNTVTNTLNAIIDRKTEDSDMPDLTIVFNNTLSKGGNL
ncbi:hypothetical protein [Deinococcus fonticola]|uniref:hypothetical protein n=1 Tax=Deinococcus fonticola TaxID=2528713 RepID=UPI0010754CEA|nr:hypothetical protein [Deinococcus fonticola]